MTPCHRASRSSEAPRQINSEDWPASSPIASRRPEARKVSFSRLFRRVKPAWLSAAVLGLLACESESGSHAEPQQHSVPGTPTSAATPAERTVDRDAPATATRPHASAPDVDGVEKVDLPQGLPPPNQRPLAESTRSIVDVFDDYGFPSPPGLTHFCKRRLIEPGALRSTIDGFTSSASPQTLIAFYEKRLTRRGQHVDDGVTRWQLPADSPAPARTLTISPTSAEGKHRLWCPQPSAAAASLLLLTRVD